MVAKSDRDYAAKVKLLLNMADDGDPLLKLYLAFQKNDMEYLNDVLYENAQMEQICQVSSPGTDHTFFSYNVMPGLLAANLPERIKLILPEENGLVRGSFSGVVIVNLFMGIWYQNQAFLDAGLAQAEKKLGQKLSGFERAYISCLKDIALKDAEALGADLEELCRSHGKRKDFEMNAFNKGFCVEAHALYNLLHWAYDGELEDRVKMHRIILQNVRRDYLSGAFKKAFKKTILLECFLFSGSSIHIKKIPIGTADADPHVCTKEPALFTGAEIFLTMEAAC